MYIRMDSQQDTFMRTATSCPNNLPNSSETPACATATEQNKVLCNNTIDGFLGFASPVELCMSNNLAIKILNNVRMRKSPYSFVHIYRVSQNYPNILF